MVGYAEGRKVDDNVSAVVIQYLNKERIQQMEATSQKHKQKAFLTRAGIILGIAVLAIALMVVGSKWFQSRAELAEARNATAVIMLITNTPLPTLTPTAQIDPGMARVDELNGSGQASFRLVGGSANPIITGSLLESGTEITTTDMGLRIVIGEQTGRSSLVYPFANTAMGLNFGEKLVVELYQGSVYVQPGAGRAEVELPNYGGAVARVQGSRMIVLANSPGQVEVQCFEGECDFRIPNRNDLFVIPVGQKRVYDLPSGTFAEAVALTYAEQWQANVLCNYCMAEIIPTPTPIATAPASFYGSQLNPSSDLVYREEKRNQSNRRASVPAAFLLTSMSGIAFIFIRRK